MLKENNSLINSITPNLTIDFEFWKNFSLVAGVDEAGRGSLFGPIVVSAVIMPKNYYNPSIKDSKVLSPQKREFLSNLIKTKSLCYSIIFKSSFEIEKKNPLVATKEAMVEAVLNLKKTPDICLIDGKEEINIHNLKTLSIISGDKKSVNIAAASIIAKVARDEYMKKISSQYPLYNLAENKGYGNKEHLLSIYKYGFCELHRKNYDPVKSLIKKPFLSKKEIFGKYKLLKDYL